MRSTAKSIYIEFNSRHEGSDRYENDGEGQEHVDGDTREPLGS